MTKMTKLKFTAYKENGKFYSEGNVETAETVKLFETEKIAQMAKQAVPFLEDGFVLVQDVDDGVGFHNHLFRANELSKYV